MARVVTPAERLPTGRLALFRRGLEWRPKARWFAAEITVVVAGVLIALALNAWWEAQQERRKESAYVSQLLEDARVNEQVLRDAILNDRGSQQRNASLLRAFQIRTAPEVDSLGVWLERPQGAYSDPRPSMGTVNALLQTGDARLLRNAATRAALSGYGSEMAADLGELSRTVDFMMSSVSRIGSRYEAVRLPLRVANAEVRFPDTEQRRFLGGYIANWPTLQEDAQVRSGLQDLATAYSMRVFYLQRMLDGTSALRRLLEVERERSS